MNEVEPKTATMNTASTSGNATEGLSSAAPASMVVASPLESFSLKNKLLTLPTELLRRVVCFLHHTDVFNFIDSNIVDGRIHFGALHPISIQDLRADDRSFTNGDIPQPYEPRIKMLCHISNIHSITLRAQWKDQGWGNQKGGLFIVASPKENVPTPKVNVPLATVDSTAAEGTESVDDPFDGGRVVAMTDTLAPHSWESVELTFNPIDGEYYYLWFRVGGDGGHLLYLRDVQVQTYIFDDQHSTYTTTFECLHTVGCVSSVNTQVPVRLNSLPRWTQISSRHVPQIRFRTRESANASDLFYPKMLLRLCQSVQRCKSSINEACKSDVNSLVNILDPAVELLSEYGIPIDEHSLCAIQDIIQTDIDEREIDWKIYEENCRNLRQRHNLDEASTNSTNGNRALHGGIPIDLRHAAAINGFRVVIPREGRQPGGADVGNNNGQNEANNINHNGAADNGIRIEPILPIHRGNDPMEDNAAAMPQVINNPDGTFTINLGNLEDVAARAVPIDVDNMNHNNHRRGMDANPPDANNPENEEMFDIARAAMAAVFGFENVDGDNNDNGNNNNRNDEFPQRGGFQNFFQQINGGMVGGGIFVGGGNNNNNNNMPFVGGFPFQNIIDLANNNNAQQQPQPPAPTEAVNDQTMTDDDDDDVEEVPIM